MLKRHKFLLTRTSYLFKCRKNEKDAGIQSKILRVAVVLQMTVM